MEKGDITMNIPLNGCNINFTLHPRGLYYKGQKTVYFLQVYYRWGIQALRMSLLWGGGGTSPGAIT